MRTFITRWGRNALVLVICLAAMVARGPMWSRGAEPPVPAPAPVPAAPVPADLVLPRNTLVPMDLVDEVSTKKSKPDDFFELRVAEAVLVLGRTAIPAGARAVGQVVDSQQGGVFGQPAKLLIAIRFVELDDRRIPMRFYQASHGADRTGQAMPLAMVPFAGLFAAFIKGGEIVLPAGTRLTAKAAQDTSLQPPPPTQPAAAAAAPAPGSAP